MKKIFLSLFCVLILSLAVYADDSLIQIKQKLEKIERDITDLQIVVFTKKDKQISDTSVNQDVTPKITVFDMRIRDMENELQAINLNNENISFEIEDLKNVVEKLSLELNDAIISINTKINSKVNISLVDKTISESNESDNVAQNQTVEENKLEENTLGSILISSNDLTESKNNIEKIEEKISYLSPEEQFQEAFDNLRSQRFDKAKLDLKLFIKEHDLHQLAGSAHYWLGEIYLLQKEYREAALVFAEGYQKYPDSIKSPDSLYKLAETLIKIEKNDDACNTLRQLISKYPNNTLINKSQAKMNEIQCS